MFGVNNLNFLLTKLKYRLEDFTEKDRKWKIEYQKLVSLYRDEIVELKKEVAKLNFKVENPAKYKVGSTHDKVWVVTEVSIEESNWISAIEEGGLFCGTGTVHDSFLKTKPKFYWRYKVVNKQTGETKTV